MNDESHFDTKQSYYAASNIIPNSQLNMTPFDQIDFYLLLHLLQLSLDKGNRTVPFKRDFRSDSRGGRRNRKL